MGKTGAGFNRGASKQDYKSPEDFMSALRKRFGPIAFDLAASDHNTQHRNYFTIRDNSLIQEWHKIPGLLFLNPPFDNIAPWAKKCMDERLLGAHIAFLVPASIGSNWFQDFVFKHSFTHGLNPRLCFDGIAPYPKDMMLNVFSPWGETGFDVWRWK